MSLRPYVDILTFSFIGCVWRSCYWTKAFFGSLYRKWKKKYLSRELHGFNVKKLCRHCSLDLDKTIFKWEVLWTLKLITWDNDDTLTRKGYKSGWTFPFNINLVVWIKSTLMSWQIKSIRIFNPHLSSSYCLSNWKTLFAWTGDLFVSMLHVLFLI